MATVSTSSIFGFGQKPTGTDAQSGGLQFKAIGQDHKNAERVAEKRGSAVHQQMKITKTAAIGSTQNEYILYQTKNEIRNFGATPFAEISFQG